MKPAFYQRKNVNRFFLFTFILLLLGLTARVSWSVLATSDCPMFRCDAQHTGQSANVGPQAANTVSSYETFDAFPINSSPVIAPNGNILAATTDGDLYYFPPSLSPSSPIGVRSTQREIWSTPAFDTNGWYYYGAIDNNGILLPSGSLFAICETVLGCPDMPDISEFPVGYPVYSSPLIVPAVSPQPNDAVVIGMGDVSGATGAVGSYSFTPGVGWTINWISSPKPGPVIASPALTLNGNIAIAYVDFSNNNLIVEVLSPSSGMIVEVVAPLSYNLGPTLPGPLTSSPVIDQESNDLFVGGFNAQTALGNLHIIPDVDGSGAPFIPISVVLPGATSTNLTSPAVVSGGDSVYIASVGGDLYAVNPVTFSIKWQVTPTVAGATFSSPVVDALGTIYLATSAGIEAFQDNGTSATSLWNLDSGTFALPPSISSPAIDSNNVLYIGSDDGSLYAVSDAAVGPFCGDNIVDPPEECDDGNATNGDGCSDTCTLESLDTDGDGLSDDEEALLGTNPNLADTDDDGLSDFDEVNVDVEPANYTVGVDTNPINDDTDGDGFLDGGEVQFGSDPLDGLSVPPATLRVSTDSTGGEANGDSGLAVASLDSRSSADGRFEVFTSAASNLVPGDTNGRRDVFVKDMETGTTTRVSTSSSGAQGNHESLNADISASGSLVVFDSIADNLVVGDTNGVRDVFVKDLLTGVTTLVSTSTADIHGLGNSSGGAISADGQFVAFQSSANNLVPNDNNGTIDIFLKNLGTGDTVRLSTDSQGAEATGTDAGDSRSAAISADGQFVAFETLARLSGADTNVFSDVYVKNTLTNQTSLVSINPNEAAGNNTSADAAISADGSVVAFRSSANDLVPGDTNGAFDIFVKNPNLFGITRVSTNSSGAQATAGSSQPDVSADGRFVVFDSIAANLVVGDTNGVRDVFVKDRKSNKTIRVSLDDSLQQANGDSSATAISANGEFVTFSSTATNLVPVDSNLATDVFRVANLLAGDSDGDGLDDGLDNCPVIPNAVDSWTPATVLENRRHATVTKMSDGRIVVAGGVRENQIEQTVIYYSDVQLWSADGQTLLSTEPSCLGGIGRALHAATRISNGRVLFTGGWDGSSSLASAIIYNANTNVCISAGNMTVPRSQHTATLVNGLSQKVFIAGGWSGGGPTASTELYTDLVVIGASHFSPGPDLSLARNTHTATFVLDCPSFSPCSSGDVYIAGGYGSGGTLSSIDLYDSGQDAIAPSGNMTTSRGGHTATLLTNGQLMFAGGFNSDINSAVASVELHPLTSVGTAGITTDTMTTPRNWHTATRLSNGDVLLAGGKTGSGHWEDFNGFLSSAELYSAATGFSAAAGLTTPRSMANAVLMDDGRVFLYGGLTGEAALASVNERYLPSQLDVDADGIGDLCESSLLLFNADFNTETVGLPPSPNPPGTPLGDSAIFTANVLVNGGLADLSDNGVLLGSGATSYSAIPDPAFGPYDTGISGIYRVSWTWAALDLNPVSGSVALNTPKGIAFIASFNLDDIVFNGVSPNTITPAYPPYISAAPGTAQHFMAVVNFDSSRVDIYREGKPVLLGQPFWNPNAGALPFTFNLSVNGPEDYAIDNLVISLIEDPLTDSDGDGVGDAVDTDDDGDGIDDAVEIANGSNPLQQDTDEDGVPDDLDNCLLTWNPYTEDTDEDGIFDANQPDGDGDGVGDVCDNCNVAQWDIWSAANAGEPGDLLNPDQADTDEDGIGDICDLEDNSGEVLLERGGRPSGGSTDVTVPNSDDDTFLDDVDNCPSTTNENQYDTDGDSLGDACDTNSFDADNDGDADGVTGCTLDIAVGGNADPAFVNCAAVVASGVKRDNCDVTTKPAGFEGATYNPLSVDTDGNGTPDAQADSDNDGLGDACEADADDDGDDRIVSGDIYDCDDTNPGIGPSVIEIQGNTIDDDCDPSTADSLFSVSFGSFSSGTESYEQWLPEDGKAATVATSVQIDPAYTDLIAGTSDITLEIISSGHPGSYLNDDITSTSPDFELTAGGPVLSTGALVADGSVLTATARDWGAALTVNAEAIVTLTDGSTRTARGSWKLPLDADDDGIGDYFESLAAVDLDPASDQEQTTTAGSSNIYNGDGLTALDEYRAVCGFELLVDAKNPATNLVEGTALGAWQTDAYVPTGTTACRRLSTRYKDLFVKHRGFGIPVGGDFPEEMPFALGAAYALPGLNLNVHVNDLGTADDADPAGGAGESNIDVALVTNDRNNLYLLSHDGHTNKSSLVERYWVWETKGKSGKGTTLTYGTDTRLYERSLAAYFDDEPYRDSTFGEPGTLDPVSDTSVVEDLDDDAEDDRKQGKYESEAFGDANILEGDIYIPGTVDWSEGLTTFDIDRNFRVELPIVDVITDAPEQSTRKQVRKHTISHELFHALGCGHYGEHDKLMYVDTPSWIRDGALSPDCINAFIIHNN